MTELTELIQQEHEAIQQSRTIRLEQGEPVDPESIRAICLSGGGVRSATFATGIFNSWAKNGGAMLRKFDYLSTVSGGGYFGAFYGRLFQNYDSTDHNNLYNELSSPNSKHIRYLKRSGRYLANSGDEGWFAAATLIRNLMWLHIMLALVLFPTFALLHYFQSADLFDHLSYGRPSLFWQDIPLIYWISMAFAAGFVITGILYFVLAGVLSKNSLRKLTALQSKLLLCFSIVLGAAVLISATKWLVGGKILALSSDDLWQYFAGLYAAIATFSASIYRIQTKIQQAIGGSINAKTFVLIVAVVAVVIYLLSASAMTLFALSLLHKYPPFPGDNCGFGLSLLLIGSISLLLGWLLSLFTESINHTSLHYFYAARLRRAFLGAANLKRFTEHNEEGKIRKGATEHDDSDDVADLRNYNICDHGGPFHLINLTLNSSRSPDGNLWWPDCKGFNLAFSSLAFNYDHNRSQLWGNSTATSKEIPGLGTSIAISGAAASTGMGSCPVLQAVF